MLIGGMGFTLAGMHALNQVRPDAELQRFLTETDRTYAAYQKPRGFYPAGDGLDGHARSHPIHRVAGGTISSTSRRAHAPAADFWDTLFAPQKTAAVVFGPASMWIESDTHFAVRGYHLGDQSGYRRPQGQGSLLHRYPRVDNQRAASRRRDL